MDAAPTRFKMRDAMILIAATGAGLGLSRGVWLANEKMLGPNRQSPGPWVDYVRFGAAVTATAALAGCLGIALFVCSTLSDRRSLRRKLAAPGFIPPFVLLLESFAEVIYYTPTWMWVATGHSSHIAGWIDARLVVHHIIGERPGALIAAVWIVQWINGRFRPETTWLDRSGRALGIFWIVLPLIWMNLATFYFR